MIVRMIHVALFVATLSLANLSTANAQKTGQYTQKAEKSRTASDDAYIATSEAVSTDDFEAAHAALLSGERLQFERPVEAAEPPRPVREPPAFFKWLGQLFGAIGPLFQLIFYAGIALIAAGIIYFIVRHIPNIRLRGLRRKDAVAEQADHIISTVRPDEKKARSWLEEADALARDGKFSEAVHLLLFRSIEDIQSRRKERIPTALTAREIERLEGLPARPRDALKPIVALVERSFFGGHSVDADNWTSARAAYEDFAFGDAWT